MYRPQARHWDMLDIYRTHLFNLYHNLKRWGLTTPIDEESKIQKQSTTPEITTAREWSSRELEVHLSSSLKTPLPSLTHCPQHCQPEENSRHKPILVKFFP